MYATVCADIVSSTSLSSKERMELIKKMKLCKQLVEAKYKGSWVRIVRGDTIECILGNSVDALEVAIIFKTMVKTYGKEKKNVEEDKYLEEDEYGKKFFKKYGLRVAIGIGDMKIVDKKEDIMDGDSIYYSGRLLNSLVGHSKYSFSISMGDKDKERVFQVVLSLVNQLLNNATPRQNEIVYNRIITGDSAKTAEKLGISVSGVNQTLNKVGWNAISDAINLFRKIIGEL